MGKIITLLCMLVLTLGSLGGYLFLTEKIIAGNVKIAEGKKQIKEGEQMLSKGKNKLAKGKKDMSNFKQVNNAINSLPLMGFVSNMPVTGTILKMGSNQMTEDGQQAISKGEKKVKAGETQLAEGKIQLSAGIERLTQANMIRIACAVGVILFGSLFIGFGIHWRRIRLRLKLSKD